MLIAYLANDYTIWITPLLIQILSYMRILKKMGKNPLLGVIPILAEKAMSEDLFRKMRFFWRPAIIFIALMLTGSYLSGSEYGLMLKLAAIVDYGLFLSVLYMRLAKQFGKSWFFGLGMILMPLIFLPLLALSRKPYLGKREFRPEKPRSPGAARFRKAVFTIV